MFSEKGEPRVQIKTNSENKNSNKQGSFFDFFFHPFLSIPCPCFSLGLEFCFVELAQPASPGGPVFCQEQCSRGDFDVLSLDLNGSLNLLSEVIFSTSLLHAHLAAFLLMH